MEWTGRTILAAVPLGFFLAAFTGRVVLALVILTPIGAYAQWSIWVTKRRLASRAGQAAQPASATSPPASVGSHVLTSPRARPYDGWPDQPH